MAADVMWGFVPLVVAFGIPVLLIAWFAPRGKNKRKRRK